MGLVHARSGAQTNFDGPKLESPSTQDLGTSGDVQTLRVLATSFGLRNDATH